jgi:transcriptional regulator of acetoin/glycerol metabolism
VLLGPGALARLLQHNWPGNVRELASVLETALLEADNGSSWPAILLCPPKRRHNRTSYPPPILKASHSMPSFAIMSSMCSILTVVTSFGLPVNSRSADRLSIAFSATNHFWHAR